MWNQPVADCLLLTSYVDPTVRSWVETTSTAADVLVRRPSP